MTICKACCRAADQITMMMKERTYREDWVQAAKMMHAECKDCDCQHDVDSQITHGR